MSGRLTITTTVLSLALAGMTSIHAAPEAANGCKLDLDGASRRDQQMTAYLDFDGLEHTWLVHPSCPREKAVEVVGGYSLPGKSGQKLYDDILLSFSGSRPGLRYIVTFTGTVTLKRLRGGPVVANITSVAQSRLQREPSTRNAAP